MPADQDTGALDLDAYLSRVQWSGERVANADTLRSVHRAHLLHIPFENGDAMVGSPPSLALPDLERKLVRSARGGYCYEHNTLLATALRAFGFHVTYLAARVRVSQPGTGGVRPRTHMTLLVRVPGSETPYLADVGFGTTALLEAVPLLADTEWDRGAWKLRLVREPGGGSDDLWVLQVHSAGDEWSDLYAFSQEPFEPADFMVANWYMATHPRSPFHHRLVAQQPGIDTHRALFGRQLIHTHGDGSVNKRELTSAAEVLHTLATDFGIELPAGTQLPA
ncbi:arylamine N-acetyltransferase family protein [Streptomyces zagrosensis]|uniref:N-hydroxyarylamine O-acetyltransferase n=1 Tax=Streptomyces zagrosensis TaxID=1042984 RepID=A0A7W9Q8R7_9ACTN|nr:arylamine N-acetyltransferase [Streptomyces zagrosensis]MBB5935723.1 N-hydroxyarylamine O-acetyltransferase [Streptomyces zagrosensis]